LVDVVLLGTVRKFDILRPSSRLRRFLEIVFPEAEPPSVHYVLGAANRLVGITVLLAVD